MSPDRAVAPLDEILRRLSKLIDAQSIEPHRAYLSSASGLRKDLSDIAVHGGGGLIAGIEFPEVPE